VPELRASSYTIYVDLPDSADQMLLVHGYSGAYDLVSSSVARYVRSLEPRRVPKPLYGQWRDLPVDVEIPVRPGDATISALTRRGYLTELTLDEEHTFFQTVADKHHQAAQKALTWVFMPTYDCNLRCFYCFQDHMRTDPRYVRLLRSMTPALVDRIFTTIRRLEDEHGVSDIPGRQRDLGLFGGEPLLAQNRPLIEHIMAAGGDTPWSMWAISNGVQLDAYADLLGPDKIATIQITLDGPPAEHDARRIHEDGTGSFEAIARNVDMALERGVLIQARMNIDRSNVDDLPELAREIIRRGWSDQRGFRAYTYPVHAANDKTAKATTFNPWELDLALNELRVTYPEMKVIDRPDDRMRNSAARVFRDQAEPPLRAEFCGAHAGMYIFDALGDIYACWERTGDEKIRIGRVLADGTPEMNAPIRADWRTRSVATVKACSHCRYALHCGGGCAVLAESDRGRMDFNHCDGFANRFRAMVAEAFEAYRAGELTDAPLADLAVAER
jgi:uncharacterized protein